MRILRISLWSGAVLIACLGVTHYVLPRVMPDAVICRHCVFHCVNSGSTKGYQKWFGILRTHHWHTNSALETFMRENFPGEFTNRWVLISASGQRLGGGWDDFFESEPPAMILSRSQINAYTSTLSDKGKKLLYELFASGDEKAIRDHWFEVSIHFP